MARRNERGNNNNQNLKFPTSFVFGFFISPRMKNGYGNRCNSSMFCELLLCVLFKKLTTCAGELTENAFEKYKFFKKPRFLFNFTWIRLGRLKIDQLIDRLVRNASNFWPIEAETGISTRDRQNKTKIQFHRISRQESRKYVLFRCVHCATNSTFCWCTQYQIAICYHR